MARTVVNFAPNRGGGFRRAPKIPKNSTQTPPLPGVEYLGLQTSINCLCNNYEKTHSTISNGPTKWGKQWC